MLSITLVDVQAGNRIKADGWAMGKRLVADDTGFATFRVAMHDGTMYAVNVKVTGRSFRRYRGETAIRVEITFPGDGEPDNVTHGWLWID